MAGSKIEILKEQIEAAAAADAKRMLDNAKKQAAAMIDGENERIAKEQGGAALAKMSRFENDERKRVSESKYAADRKVLLHRNSLVDGLFGEIRDELAKITASGEYKARLSAMAESADKHHKLGGNVCAYCRKADLDTAREVLGKYGVKVEPDRNIRLGGLIFKYPDKGLYIDLTFDSAFEAQREAFSARSEMQL